MRRPVGGGAWQPVTQLHVSGSAGDLIATQARVAAILDGTSVIVTANGGLSTLEHATPCTTQGVAYATSVAVTGPDSLALLCSGGAAMGSVHQDHLRQQRSRPALDEGRRTAAGRRPALARGRDARPAGGVGGQRRELAVLLGQRRRAVGQRVRGRATAAMGFNDLGFTTTSDGVVVYGPALTDGNSEGRPGRLLLTEQRRRELAGGELLAPGPRAPG